MTLIEKTLFETIDKEQMAIDRIKDHCPSEGYYLAFSGGKDSIVLKDLTIRAGVNFDAHYNVTGIDPPEIARFIKKYHPEVQFKITLPSIFRRTIEKQSPPTRKIRWCCEEYKENDGDGRTILLGIRRAESVKRGKRRLYEVCKKNSTKIYLNPIIDWENEDVWEYIHKYRLPYCSLYDLGYKRIGCVMCPMSGKNGMKRDAERYPKIARRWKKVFEQMPGYTYEWWINQARAKDERQECFAFDND